MQRAFIAGAVLGAVALVLSSSAAAARGADAVRGKQLYLATGCYQCHGTRGAGGASGGPRLAPTPIPFQALVLQLRQPRARMPAYTQVVMPDRDVADIYAYLLSVPKGRTAAEIPLLNGLPVGGRSQ